MKSSVICVSFVAKQTSEQYVQCRCRYVDFMLPQDMTKSSPMQAEVVARGARARFLLS